MAPPPSTPPREPRRSRPARDRPPDTVGPRAVRHPAPAETGGPAASRRFPRDPDVDSTVVWCETCAEESIHQRTFVDVSPEEEASEAPDVRQALTGEEGWVCTRCGSFSRDPIADDAYEYEYSNVGYEVRPFTDEETTVREAQSSGVTPPERIHGELRRKDDEEGGVPTEWETRERRDRR